MKAEQIERLEALLALPGFPFGGPMFASDLCEFDEDGEPVEGSWDLESREIIAACVNFMCANGTTLLQLARAVQSATTSEADSEGWVCGYVDEKLAGQTVALVPVPVKEG